MEVNLVSVPIDPPSCVVRSLFVERTALFFAAGTGAGFEGALASEALVN
jgi:hypothetical protein